MPAQTSDLRGGMAQFGPPRDEGIEYARRLAQANVPVELHLFPGTFHRSATAADAAVSQRMPAETVVVLRGAF